MRLWIHRTQRNWRRSPPRSPTTGYESPFHATLSSDTSPSDYHRTSANLKALLGSDARYSILLHVAHKLAHPNVSLIHHLSIPQPRSSRVRIFPMHFRLNARNQPLTSQTRTSMRRRVVRLLLFSRLHLSDRNSSVRKHSLGIWKTMRGLERVEILCRDRRSKVLSVKCRGRRVHTPVLLLPTPSCCSPHHVQQACHLAQCTLPFLHLHHLL